MLEFFPSEFRFWPERTKGDFRTDSSVGQESNYNRVEKNKSRILFSGSRVVRGVAAAASEQNRTFVLRKIGKNRTFPLSFTFRSSLPQLARSTLFCSLQVLFCENGTFFDKFYNSSASLELLILSLSKQEPILNRSNSLKVLYSLLKGNKLIVKSEIN